MFDYNYVFSQLGFIKRVEVNKPGDIWRNEDGRQYMIVSVCKANDSKRKYAMMDMSDYHVFGVYDDIDELVNAEFGIYSYSKVKK